MNVLRASCLQHYIKERLQRLQLSAWLSIICPTNMVQIKLGLERKPWELMGGAKGILIGWVSGK